MPKGANRIALVNSERQPVFGAKRVGKPDPREQVEVTVYLRQASPTPRVREVRSPKKRLNRQEFAERHGARPQDIKRVQQFARNHGLKVARVNRASAQVVLSGPVQAMEKAFGTSLELQEVQGQMFRARQGTLSVAKPMAGIIEDVLGLDSRPQAKPHFRVLKSVSAEGQTLAAAVARRAPRRVSSFTGAQVASLYQFPPGTDGSGQCIALIELGGGFRAADVNNYFKKINIKPPAVVAISVDHAHNRPTGDPTGPDGEVLLDIQVAGAAAPGAKIAVYFAPNTDRGFVDAIMATVHDNVNKPSVISISWGAAEVNWTQQARRQMSKAFAAAALMHITVLAAAGDDGSSDGEPDGAAHVDFPASEPNVLACGGTRLLTKNGKSITEETVWNNGPGRGATGGGVSECYALPEYQKSAGVPKSINTQFAGRGVPDVAGVADPETGFAVQVDGQSMVIGGTSAVAPLYAALVARLNQALGRPVGLLHPILYGGGASSQSFRDVTQGNNGGYAAGPKWDACTGWGSINGVGLMNLLRPGGPAPAAKPKPEQAEQESAKPGPRRRRNLMRRRRLKMRRKRMLRRQRLMQQRDPGPGNPAQPLAPAAGSGAPKGQPRANPPATPIRPGPGRPQHGAPRLQQGAQRPQQGAPGMQQGERGSPQGAPRPQAGAARPKGPPPRPLGAASHPKGGPVPMHQRPGMGQAPGAKGQPPPRVPQQMPRPVGGRPGAMSPPMQRHGAVPGGARPSTGPAPQPGAPGAVPPRGTPAGGAPSRGARPSPNAADAGPPRAGPAKPSAQKIGTAPAGGQIPQWALDRMASVGRSPAGPAARPTPSRQPGLPQGQSPRGRAPQGAGQRPPQAAGAQPPAQGKGGR